MTKADDFPTTDDKTEREEGTLFAPQFDSHGLLPVIVTSAKTGDVLMFAYMNAEALARSIETGEAHYWSRSREALWRKGETSGNAQRIVEMRTDCDQDVLWLKVEMTGAEASCHTGRKSCFYRAIPLKQGLSGSLVFVEAERQFDPEAVYGHADAAKGTLKSS
ncbi:MAG: phosphoribosyl-AMP cyclohydrolase [Methyloceanibacter sp.]|uniref:phosphoribosyl-AMP cyclohydrolase n=1 Tax=Methyloceanibacter sp. TaxID=1965321 RepID=UPI003D6D62E2